jgi:hypothetical protein
MIWTRKWLAWTVTAWLICRATSALAAPLFLLSCAQPDNVMADGEVCPMHHDPSEECPMHHTQPSEDGRAAIGGPCAPVDVSLIVLSSCTGFIASSAPAIAVTTTAQSIAIDSNRPLDLTTPPDLPPPRG